MHAPQILERLGVWPCKVECVEQPGIVEEVCEQTAVFGVDVQLLMWPVGHQVPGRLHLFGELVKVQLLLCHAPQHLGRANGDHQGRHARLCHERLQGDSVLDGVDQIPHHGQNVLTGTQVQRCQQAFNMTSTRGVELETVPCLPHQLAALLATIDESKVLVQNSVWLGKCLCPGHGQLRVHFAPPRHIDEEKDQHSAGCQFLLAELEDTKWAEHCACSCCSATQSLHLCLCL
mmetsp:Transcript_18807/g.32095  ORF Transcript_18807/g.32095 Transcript_18807/m.32095 type:complete len:232 (-) Transcript_18807:270-965(-)